MLKCALREWRRISDSDGCFDYSETVHPIFHRPGILLRSSTMILVEGDNPLGWIFAWFGGGFGVYGNKSFLGRTIGQIPDLAYANAVAEPLAAAVRDREIAYHRVFAALDHTFVDYDRLILPMKENGKVTALITTSVSTAFPPPYRQ
jgi:hypothetical protein